MIGEEASRGDPELVDQEVKVIQNPSDTLILNTIAEEKLDQIDADTTTRRRCSRSTASCARATRPRSTRRCSSSRRSSSTTTATAWAVGRFRINRKFDLDVPEDQMFIRGEDFLRVIQYILDLRSNRVDPDTRPQVAQRRSTTSTTWATAASARSTSWPSRSSARASSSSAAPSRSA
jgi:hypothetical protein